MSDLETVNDTSTPEGAPHPDEAFVDRTPADSFVAPGAIMSAVPDDGREEAAAAQRGIRQFLPRMSLKLGLGLGIVLAIVLFGILGPLFVQDPVDSDNPALSPPSADHWLGTTKLGYDVFAQLAYGTAGSLQVGFVAGILVLVLSIVFGILAGYSGGWTDEFLSLFTNIMLVIPGLPLAMVIATYMQGRSWFLVAIVLGITGWAGSAVVLRSQARSLRARDYVAASRVAGETGRVIFVEILPNLLPLLAAQFLFAIIFAILGEAGLSYLGLGPTGSITWGTVLNDAQTGQAVGTGAWWWFVPPGLMIALLGAGLSLINFSIDEIINPKLRLAPDNARRVRKAARAGRGIAGLEGVGIMSYPGHGDPVLTARGVSIEYEVDSPVKAVRDVSLTLHRGEILGLAGESGCGKTTLAYGLNRLLKPPALMTSGEVVFHDRDGHDIDVVGLSAEGLRAFRWDKVSMVFQGAMNSLNPVISVKAQLFDVFSTHRPGMTRKQKLERSEELLALVGVDPSRLTSYPHELSGGMRQRVMIAMALALDPQVMIMDEPTTALDVVVQRGIIREIMRLRERLGFAVIFITHDLPMLIEISDRIAVMLQGQIVELGTAEKIYREPQHDYTKKLLASFPSLRGDRGDFVRTGASISQEAAS